MNAMLAVGSLLVLGYIMGWLMDKIGLPRIIGYILTGMLFSPYNYDLLNPQVIESTEPLLKVSLAFIAFEIGGTLKWSKIIEHEKEIISITLMASIIPFVLIAGAILAVSWMFPSIIPVDHFDVLMLAILLGALSSPTEPAATLAVMRQYGARGKVSDTILGVAALDDVLGILLFSLTIAVLMIITDANSGLITNPVVNALYELGAGILLGAILGMIIDPLAGVFNIKTEGQWVVILFALIVLCVGIADALQADVLLATMTMGIVVVNKCKQQKIIFRILERYTEDLIFLFFFSLSGLHLDISTIPQATTVILIFVLFRTLGKYLGVATGARMVQADHSIRKFTAGGLLPQGGVVIGLVLSIYQIELFEGISELLLTTTMGAMVIHELVGPLAAKHTLSRAGELHPTDREETS